MTREIISNDRTGEKYTRIKHDSGLEILIWKTEGYSIKHALFGTRYGSVNTTFKTRDDADFVTVPNGIAHYLEHKLFENEDCGVFELYAKTGAFGNAYTSFDRTCYLFSCTENFIPSLKILLDFVQKPYFTEETVRKEQGRKLEAELKAKDEEIAGSKKRLEEALTQSTKELSATKKSLDTEKSKNAEMATLGKATYAMDQMLKSYEELMDIVASVGNFDKVAANKMMIEISKSMATVEKKCKKKLTA